MSSKQTASSLNNPDKPEKFKIRNYKDKYNLDPSLVNKYSAWVSNPTVQPDAVTEMGVPIPTEQNTEYSKEYEEENEL